MKSERMFAWVGIAAALLMSVRQTPAAQPDPSASTIPSIPVGVLDAQPTIVQTGTKPTLTWAITYPSKVGDLVEINPPGTLIPNDTVYTDVVIVGTDIKCSSSCETIVAARPARRSRHLIAAIGSPDWHGGSWLPIALPQVQFLAGLRRHLAARLTSLPPAPSTTAVAATWMDDALPGAPMAFAPLAPPRGRQSQQVIYTPPPNYTSPPTEARVSVNGGLYQQLFYGTQADVDPAHSLFIKKLLKGDTLDFGGRFVINGTWSPFYTTRSSNLQVVALVNGDVPPTNFSLYRQGFLESYLAPYLDASGRVSIGPLSVLIVMELDNSDHANGCFDYQDQILLVTFSKKHPNNGHGNNLDGVDCSNPGQGHGGPNGEIDLSGGVDDEIR